MSIVEVLPAPRGASARARGCERVPIQAGPVDEPTSAVGSSTDGVAPFPDFVRTHLPALLRYGTALTGNPHDGADLVQIACEKAGAVWPRVAASDHPLAYIKAIMANARVSAWRRHRREHSVADLPDVSHRDVYPSETSPLWAAVAALPPRQRAVVVLRYVEGHSEAEIAALLRVSPGTVKSQASKAMATLRRVVPDGQGWGGEQR